MTRYVVILAVACVLAVFSPQLIERVVAIGRANEKSVIAKAPPAAAPQTSADYGSGRRVRLQAHKSGHYLADALINNQQMKVMVDTGATVVALTAEDARRAGLQPMPSEFNVPVRTANGIAHTARVTLREVGIGGVRVRNVEALVSQPGALGVTLLGMAFLGRLKQVTMRDGELLLVE